jgi:hypothetical protein
MKTESCAAAGNGDPLPPPRLALLISDPRVRNEIESLLKERPGGFLVVNEPESLRGLSMPVVLISDSIKEIAELKELPLPEGSRLLAIQTTWGGEAASASFVAGADDTLRYPLEAAQVLEKVDKAFSDFSPRSSENAQKQAAGPTHAKAG